MDNAGSLYYLLLCTKAINIPPIEIQNIECQFQVGEFCKEKNLPLHCDGARLFNAAAQLGVPASSLVEPCDSVSVCLSKGLGAPVGSVVVGKKDFIARFD